MISIMRIILAAAVIIIGATNTMAIEEAQYNLVKKDGKFEIRDYVPYILAETVVDGDIEQAGSKAFKRLFRYISGGNRSQQKVAMTAPVSQQPRGEKIEMTAPVGQRSIGGQWVVSFMMPASYTLETLPQPDNPKISLRLVAAHRIAAVRYSGFWSEKKYLRYRKKLVTWVDKEELTAVGNPVWARYNSPFTPWFLRRNEILIPVDANTD